MSTLNLHVQYRPIRVGWCIQANNFDEYKRALRFTHTLWGGRYNPLIVVDNFNKASELVDLFKVDVLFPVSDDQSIIDFINRFPYLPWPHHFDKGLFIRWMKAREPVFLDIFQSALRLRSDLNKENAFSKFQLNLINWDENDPLSAVFNAMFGCLPSRQELDTEFDYKELLADTLTTNTIQLNAPEIIDAALIKTPTINWLSKYLLSGKRSIGWSTPGFYIGSVNDFTDLVNFWNLRACGIPLIYYDPVFKDRFSKLKEDHISKLRSQPPTTYEPTPSVGIWLQESNHDTFDQKEFEGHITICQIGSASWNGLNIKTPIWHFKGKTVLGVLSDANHKSLAFQLPPKPTCNDTPETNQYLVATANIYGSTFDEDHTFDLPYVPELNRFYGQATFHLDKFRVEPNGLGLIIHHNDNSSHLQSINVKKLAQEIFELYGMKLTSSEAGIKTSRIIKQVGGLHNCRIFKIRGVRQLIEEHSPYASFRTTEATKIIGQIDPITNQPDFDRYKMLYLDGAKVTPSSAFNYLAQKDVFRVGIELICPNCDLKFWRMLDSVKSKSICELCSHKFNILTQLKDRDWFYRRSGIFGLDDNQAGGIPVVLTLNQLLSNFHSDTFLYVTAMNIEFDGTNKKCETDFIIISWNRDGKVSIVVSECKTRNPIEAQDVENLKIVADKLVNKHIEAYILFSKLADFSDAEVELCMQAQEQYRDRVIMLTERELESSFLYEEAMKSFQIENCGTNWESMARNTKVIFHNEGGE
jgi:hypothetical protein